MSAEQHEHRGVANNVMNETGLAARRIVATRSTEAVVAPGSEGAPSGAPR